MKCTQRGTYDYAAQEDRSAPRIDVILAASLRAVGGKKLNTVVRNISLSGFCATAIAKIAPGTSCWLSIPGHQVMKAQVVWWEQGRVGCAFEQLLEPAILDAIIAKAD